MPDDHPRPIAAHDARRPSCRADIETQQSTTKPASAEEALFLKKRGTKIIVFSFSRRHLAELLGETPFCCVCFITQRAGTERTLIARFPLSSPRCSHSCQYVQNHEHHSLHEKRKGKDVRRHEQQRGRRHEVRRFGAGALRRRKRRHRRG